MDNAPEYIFQNLPTIMDNAPECNIMFIFDFLSFRPFSTIFDNDHDDLSNTFSLYNRFCL